MDATAAAGSPPCWWRRAGGWNHKRVERIWREEGLKVPQRQPKRRRLRLNGRARTGGVPQRQDLVPETVNLRCERIIA